MKKAQNLLPNHQWLLRALMIWLSSRIVVLSGILGTKLNLDWSIFHRWDSGWYELIVNHGYQYAVKPSINGISQESSVAFFPIYPLIIKLFTYLGIDFLIAGTLISNIAFFAVIILFYRWIESNYTPKIAYWSTICLAFNPVALYGSVIYPESVFLLFSLLALQYYQKFNAVNAANSADLSPVQSDSDSDNLSENPVSLVNQKTHLKNAGYLAGLFSMLTTATRLNGLAIIATFLIDNLISDFSKFDSRQVSLLTKIKQHFANITKDFFIEDFFSPNTIAINNSRIVLMAMGGIGSYMLFCWLNFGNPLIFLLAQSAWRQGVQDTYWGEIWIYSFNVIIWGWRNFAAGNIIDLTHPIGVIALILFAGIWWCYRYQVGVKQSSLWVAASAIGLWQITTDTGLTIGLLLISTYLLWHYRHQIKRLHWLYSVFCLLIIYGSGRTMSLQRFLFGCITLPISFGILFSRYPYLGYVLMTGSGILLFYNSIGWAQRLWVS